MEGRRLSLSSGSGWQAPQVQVQAPQVQVQAPQVQVQGPQVQVQGPQVQVQGPQMQGPKLRSQLTNSDLGTLTQLGE